MKDHPNPMPRELFGDFMGHETLGEALDRAEKRKTADIEPTRCPACNRHKAICICIEADGLDGQGPA